MRRLFAIAVCLVALPAGAGKPESRPLRGYYYWGKDLEALHPCGVRQSFWVTGDAKLLKKLREDSIKVATPKGGAPVYVEASGVTEREVRYPDDEFDYGMYRLTSVQRISADGPADCPVH